MTEEYKMIDGLNDYLQRIKPCNKGKFIIRKVIKNNPVVKAFKTIVLEIKYTTFNSITDALGVSYSGNYSTPEEIGMINSELQRVLACNIIMYTHSKEFKELIDGI